MSESTEQQALIYWFRLQYPDKIIYANANAAWFGGIERGRRAAYGALRKREGLLAGVSDLFIPESKHYGGCRELIARGLFLEMKDVKKTQCSVTPAQKQFLEDMRARGYEAHVAFGFEQAKVIIEYYMEGVI